MYTVVVRNCLKVFCVCSKENAIQVQLQAHKPSRHFINVKRTLFFNWADQVSRCKQPSVSISELLQRQECRLINFTIPLHLETELYRPNLDVLQPRMAAAFRIVVKPIWGATGPL